MWTLKETPGMPTQKGDTHEDMMRNCKRPRPTSNTFIETSIHHETYHTLLTQFELTNTGCSSACFPMMVEKRSIGYLSPGTEFTTETCSSIPENGGRGIATCV